MKLPDLEETVEGRIFLIRGQRVMLDRHLAELYRITTGNLNKAVDRNRDRFPEDFMFRLDAAEYKSLRFQLGILKRGEHSKYRPRVFTEQGVAMLSSVLRSKTAVHVNIAIMRIFVRLRHRLVVNKELAQKLMELEQRIEGHDEEIHSILQALSRLTDTLSVPAKKIGFQP